MKFTIVDIEVPEAVFNHFNEVVGDLKESSYQTAKVLNEQIDRLKAELEAEKTVVDEIYNDGLSDDSKNYCSKWFKLARERQAQRGGK